MAKGMYTAEENVRMLIALLKKYNIKRVIASPGTKNISFIGSIQYDDFFEIYSVSDERSAAYMACGMAAETKEPVCLSCTGATASRNYIPGLTEAYYRKLPVIAITSCGSQNAIGQNVEQVIDRRNQLNDMVCFSTHLPPIDNDDDRWGCEININKALIAARRHGGGPVHINLESTTGRKFTESELPDTRKIDYYTYTDLGALPKVSEGKVAIYIGNHEEMSGELQDSITRFCAKYNAVVLCGRTSNYFGKYRILPSLVIKQDSYKSEVADIDLLIHIGNVSGDQFRLKPKKVWRVNPDGEIRDTYKKLSAVFELDEKCFFDSYVKAAEGRADQDDYYQKWAAEVARFESNLPELPFSNIWIAQQTMKRLPDQSVIHMGILNSLRSWDYVDSENPFPGYSNTGGFGIDGGISSAIGGALANPERPHFCFIGDLAFFYDMNSLGNRHVPDNIKILLVNNGRGAEFRKYNHPGSAFGEDADWFMAAGGHFGSQSPDLVKHFAEDLGFEYYTADSKEEYAKTIDAFINSTHKAVFEVFTDYSEDSNAIKMINNLDSNKMSGTKNLAKTILGDKGVKKIKSILHKK